MVLGLLGKKKGMTQVFNKEGDAVGVTLIEVGPCTVVQKRTKERDGYEALQLGFEGVKEKRLSKPQQGHFKSRKMASFRYLKEFGGVDLSDFNEGQLLGVAAFKPGEKIEVRGVTKGRGFQGVIKRHGHAGGPDAHGSRFHRTTGSIGQNSSPSRVFKNMKMPGHMGSIQVLTQGLEVVSVLPEENLLLVKGAVPGGKNGLVEIFNCAGDFASRFKAEASKETGAVEEAPAEESTEEGKI